MSEIFEDIEGVEFIVDDLLIWGESDQQHDDCLMQFKNSCSSTAHSPKGEKYQRCE